MKYLENLIKKYGSIKNSDVLKVDTFLNHQILPDVVDKLADEIIRIYSDKKFTKILTIETSGIAIAYPIAQKLGIPLVYAKKQDSVNIDGELYSSKVISHTHFREYDVIVSKKFIDEKDSVLIVDDFLSNGSPLMGLLSICQQANAKIDGIGIVIEKCYQRGGREIRDKGYRIESLAMIEELDEKNNKIIFKR